VIVTNGTKFVGTVPAVEGRQPTVTGSVVLHDHMVFSHDFNLSKAYDNELTRAMGMTWIRADKDGIPCYRRASAEQPIILRKLWRKW
jgi:hypothetical protein